MEYKGERVTESDKHGLTMINCSGRKTNLIFSYLVRFGHIPREKIKFRLEDIINLTLAATMVTVIL
jgi:hypothetical protein